MAYRTDTWPYFSSEIPGRTGHIDFFLTPHIPVVFVTLPSDDCKHLRQGVKRNEISIYYTGCSESHSALRYLLAYMFQYAIQEVNMNDNYKLC